MIISSTMRQFLRAYKEEAKVYSSYETEWMSRQHGLCHNISLWCAYEGRSVTEATNLMIELYRLLDMCSLPRDNPFCSYREYIQRRENSSQHWLKARMEWIDGVLGKYREN